MFQGWRVGLQNQLGPFDSDRTCLVSKNKRGFWRLSWKVIIVDYLIGFIIMATEKWKKEHSDQLRKYRREWYYKNKDHAKAKIKERKNALKKWFIDYKKTLRCEKCDEKRWYVLEFHHKDPSIKEINLSHISHNGWSKKRVLTEVKKCVVFCANCHRELHYLQKITLESESQSSILGPVPERHMDWI